MYILTLRVAQWDTLDDYLEFLVRKGKIFLSVLMASIMCLHFSMQDEDILSILMASYTCVHFSQLVDYCVTYACTS